jgi:Sucrose synthase
MATPRLERMRSLRERVEDTLSEHRNYLVALLSKYVAQGKGILQQHHLLDAFEAIEEHARNRLSEGHFLEVLKSSQVSKKSLICFIYFFYYFCIYLFMCCPNLSENYQKISVTSDAED